jgi:hypothetical protein
VAALEPGRTCASCRIRASFMSIVDGCVLLVCSGADGRVVPRVDGAVEAFVVSRRDLPAGRGRGPAPGHQVGVGRSVDHLARP